MFQKAQAWTGNLNVISDNDSLNQNWSVPKYPRLVIALGLLQPELAGKYATYSFDFFLKERPDLDIRVLLAATNKEIVEELQDPKTIGIIFISHNFKTSLGSAALMDASASPLPSNILSAATPALRFAAFIGCHGPDIQKHYQVKYELSRLEGHQKVYTPESSVITTQDILFVLESGVKEALRELAKEMKEYHFSKGITPSPDRFGVLSFHAQDIIFGIEPRFVLVNGKIVGTLGGGSLDEFQGFSEGYVYFNFGVPDSFFGLDQGFQKVEIRSSELTPGAPCDDYLISDIKLKLPKLQLSWSKRYLEPLHLGDDPTPYQGESVEIPTKIETHEDIEHIQRYLKDVEWLNRDPAHWPLSYQRFYSDKLYLDPQ